MHASAGIEPVRRAKRSLGGTSILSTEKSSMIPYVRLHLHVVIICRNANITCDTASSCDKVSFVDVFSPWFMSRQYKQNERSMTRTEWYHVRSIPLKIGPRRSSSSLFRFYSRKKSCLTLPGASFSEIKILSYAYLAVWRFLWKTNKKQ